MPWNDPGTPAKEGMYRQVVQYPALGSVVSLGTSHAASPDDQGVKTLRLPGVPDCQQIRTPSESHDPLRIKSKLLLSR